MCDGATQLNCKILEYRTAGEERKKGRRQVLDILQFILKDLSAANYANYYQSQALKR
jgi:hypothetical protein